MGNLPIGHLALKQLFEVLGHYGYVKFAIIPGKVSGSQCSIVRLAILAYPFGYDLFPWKQLAMFHATK